MSATNIFTLCFFFNKEIKLTLELKEKYHDLLEESTPLTK